MIDINKLETIKMKSRLVVGRVTGFMTTTSLDRDGERIELATIEKMKYQIEQDGVKFVFLEHDKSKPPIGRIKKCEIRKGNGFIGLWCENDVFDKSALEAMKSGMLNGFSIGASVKE